MTFYYSMKQMFRSPLKSFLFFLLIGVSAFFVVLGGNLLYMTMASTKEFEKIYTTIGTVEQTKKDAGMVRFRNAFTNEYDYLKTYKYGERVKEDVLDFKGADYILKPRQRPYFGAYVADMYQGVGHANNIQVEATLMEPPTGQPAKMKITRVMEGYVQEGDIIYIRDLEKTDTEPTPFEMGKTYVMRLEGGGYTEGQEIVDGKEVNVWAEYRMFNGIQSLQYTLDGEKIDDPLSDEISKTSDELQSDIAWADEVTEGFYDTERGKRWIEASRQQDLTDHLVYVQPTDGTDLLMPFYRNEVVITEGRDITEEEYKKGEKVCLISDILAIQLRKSLGEQLTLPLYYADYDSTPGDLSRTGTYYLNAKGQVYSIFNEQDYQIVGIYTIKDRGAAYSAGGSYAIENHGKEVVIPWNAVPENSWKDNIVAYGRMIGANTSFQIPNGSITEFEKLWEKQGIDDIRITFYDKGYSQIKDGIESRKLMSIIFLISGCVMAFMILLFFSNVFITGQQKRIAVERILGRTKKQCAASILTGLLVLAAAGCIVGSVAGWKATGMAAKKADTEIVFDTSYSNSSIADEEKIKEKWIQPDMGVALGTGGALIVAAFLISSCYIRENLKKEPLELLGRIEE